MIGIFMCLFSGEINGLLRQISGMTTYDMTINVTPAVEELLKALPIVFVTYVFRPRRQALMEYSVAVGVGFAILENAYILAGTAEHVSLYWALIRGFGAGMVHGLCTLSVGYAMSYIRTKRKLSYTGTFAALSLAIIYHSIYNLIIQSDFRFFGILLPVLTYIPLLRFIRRQKR
ncbi:MAG: PrsW family intramembrane metalloprotease [Clostridia bacterium]|nr:PrsW family intramembrane metalloprotease [Clostridia bacterium]